MVILREPYHEYPRILRQKALGCVFDSLWFEDPKFGQIVRSSYFANMLPMMQHAHKNRIDELEYLLDIRQTLLKMNGVHEIQGYDKMTDPTPEQIRDHVCPYDGAHCWEFQNELDARKKQTESLGIRFRENMFVHPGQDFFAECPNINKAEFNCARYNMWLKKHRHGK